MKKKKLFNLTKDQQNKLDVLTWLLSEEDKDRGTGRTTLLAMAFLDKAIASPGKYIRVFDHYDSLSIKNHVIMLAIEINCPGHLRPFLYLSDRGIRFNL